MSTTTTTAPFTMVTGSMTRSVVKVECSFREGPFMMDSGTPASFTAEECSSLAMGIATKATFTVGLKKAMGQSSTRMETLIKANGRTTNYRGKGSSTSRMGIITKATSLMEILTDKG